MNGNFTKDKSSKKKKKSKWHLAKLNSKKHQCTGVTLRCHQIVPSLKALNTGRNRRRDQQKMTRKLEEHKIMDAFTSRMLFVPKLEETLTYPLMFFRRGQENGIGGQSGFSTTPLSDVSTTENCMGRTDTMVIFSNHYNSSDSTTEMTSPQSYNTRTSNPKSESFEKALIDDPKQCYISKSGTFCMTEDMYPLFVEWYNFVQNNKETLKQDFQFFGKMKPIQILQKKSESDNVTSTTADSNIALKDNAVTTTTRWKDISQRYPSFLGYERPVSANEVRKKPERGSQAILKIPSKNVFETRSADSNIKSRSIPVNVQDRNEEANADESKNRTVKKLIINFGNGSVTKDAIVLKATPEILTSPTTLTDYVKTKQKDKMDTANRLSTRQPLNRKMASRKVSDIGISKRKEEPRKDQKKDQSIERNNLGQSMKRSIIARKTVGKSGPETKYTFESSNSQQRSSKDVSSGVLQSSRSVTGRPRERTPYHSRTNQSLPRKIENLKCATTNSDNSKPNEETTTTKKKMEQRISTSKSSTVNIKRRKSYSKQSVEDPKSYVELFRELESFRAKEEQKLKKLLRSKPPSQDVRGNKQSLKYVRLQEEKQENSRQTTLKGTKLPDGSFKKDERRKEVLRPKPLQGVRKNEQISKKVKPAEEELNIISRSKTPQAGRKSECMLREVKHQEDKVKEKNIVVGKSKNTVQSKLTPNTEVTNKAKHQTIKLTVGSESDIPRIKARITELIMRKTEAKDVKLKQTRSCFLCASHERRDSLKSSETKNIEHKTLKVLDQNEENNQRKHAKETRTKKNAVDEIPTTMVDAYISKKTNEPNKHTLTINNKKSTMNVKMYAKDRDEESIQGQLIAIKDSVTFQSKTLGKSVSYYLDATSKNHIQNLEDKTSRPKKVNILPSTCHSARKIEDKEYFPKLSRQNLEDDRGKISRQSKTNSSYPARGSYTKVDGINQSPKASMKDIRQSSKETDRQRYPPRTTSIKSQLEFEDERSRNLSRRTYIFKDANQKKVDLQRKEYFQENSKEKESNGKKLISKKTEIKKCYCVPMNPKSKNEMIARDVKEEVQEKRLAQEEKTLKKEIIGRKEKIDTSITCKEKQQTSAVFMKFARDFKDIREKNIEEKNESDDERYNTQQQKVSNDIRGKVDAEAKTKIAERINNTPNCPSAMEKPGKLKDNEEKIVTKCTEQPLISSTSKIKKAFGSLPGSSEIESNIAQQKMRSDEIFQQIERDWSWWEKLLLLENLNKNLSLEDKLLRKETEKFVKEKLKTSRNKQSGESQESVTNVIPIFVNTNLKEFSESEETSEDILTLKQKGSLKTTSLPTTPTSFSHLSGDTPRKEHPKLREFNKDTSDACATTTSSSVYTFIKKLLFCIKVSNASLKEQRVAVKKNNTSRRPSRTTSADDSTGRTENEILPSTSEEAQNNSSSRWTRSSMGENLTERNDKRVKTFPNVKPYISKVMDLRQLLKNKPKGILKQKEQRTSPSNVYTSTYQVYTTRKENMSLSDLIELYTQQKKKEEKVKFRPDVEVYLSAMSDSFTSNGIIDPCQKDPDSRKYADRLFLAYKRRMWLRSGVRKLYPDEDYTSIIPMYDWKRRLNPVGVPPMLTRVDLRVKPDSSVLKISLPNTETCIAELGLLNDGKVDERHIDTQKLEKITRVLMKDKYEIRITPEELKYVAERTGSYIIQRGSMKSIEGDERMKGIISSVHDEEMLTDRTHLKTQDIQDECRESFSKFLKPLKSIFYDPRMEVDTSCADENVVESKIWELHPAADLESLDISTMNKKKKREMEEEPKLDIMSDNSTCWSLPIVTVIPSKPQEKISKEEEELLSPEGNPYSEGTPTLESTPQTEQLPFLKIITPREEKLSSKSLLEDIPSNRTSLISSDLLVPEVVTQSSIENMNYHLIGSRVPSIPNTYADATQRLALMKASLKNFLEISSISSAIKDTLTTQFSLSHHFQNENLPPPIRVLFLIPSKKRFPVPSGILSAPNIIAHGPPDRTHVPSASGDSIRLHIPTDLLASDDSSTPSPPSVSGNATYVASPSVSPTLDKSSARSLPIPPLPSPDPSVLAPAPQGLTNSTSLSASKRISSNDPPQIILVDLEENEVVDCECGSFKVVLKAPRAGDDLDKFKIIYHKNCLEVTAPSRFKKTIIDVCAQSTQIATNSPVTLDCQCGTDIPWHIIKSVASGSFFKSRKWKKRGNQDRDIATQCDKSQCDNTNKAFMQVECGRNKDGHKERESGIKRNVNASNNKHLKVKSNLGSSSQSRKKLHVGVAQKGKYRREMCKKVKPSHSTYYYLNTGICSLSVITTPEKRKERIKSKKKYMTSETLGSGCLEKSIKDRKVTVKRSVAVKEIQTRDTFKNLRKESLQEIVRGRKLGEDIFLNFQQKSSERTKAGRKIILKKCSISHIERKKMEKNKPSNNESHVRKLYIKRILSSERNENSIHDNFLERKASKEMYGVKKERCNKRNMIPPDKRDDSTEEENTVSQKNSLLKGFFKKLDEKKKKNKKFSITTHVHYFNTNPSSSAFNQRKRMIYTRTGAVKKGSESSSDKSSKSQKSENGRKISSSVSETSSSTSTGEIDQNVPKHHFRRRVKLLKTRNHHNYYKKMRGWVRIKKSRRDAETAVRRTVKFGKSKKTQRVKPVKLDIDEVKFEQMLSNVVSKIWWQQNIFPTPGTSKDSDNNIPQIIARVISALEKEEFAQRAKREDFHMVISNETIKDSEENQKTFKETRTSTQNMKDDELEVMENKYCKANFEETVAQKTSQNSKDQEERDSLKGGSVPIDVKLTDRQSSSDVKDNELDTPKDKDEKANSENFKQEQKTTRSLVMETNITFVGSFELRRNCANEAGELSTKSTGTQVEESVQQITFTKIEETGIDFKTIFVKEQALEEDESLDGRQVSGVEDPKSVETFLGLRNTLPIDARKESVNRNVKPVDIGKASAIEVSKLIETRQVAREDGIPMEVKETCQEIHSVKLTKNKDLSSVNEKIPKQSQESTTVEATINDTDDVILREESELIRTINLNNSGRFTNAHVQRHETDNVEDKKKENKSVMIEYISRDDCVHKIVDPPKPKNENFMNNYFVSNEVNEEVKPMTKTDNCALTVQVLKEYKLETNTPDKLVENTTIRVVDAIEDKSILTENEGRNIHRELIKPCDIIKPFKDPSTEFKILLFKHNLLVEEEKETENKFQKICQRFNSGTNLLISCIQEGLTFSDISCEFNPQEPGTTVQESYPAIGSKEDNESDKNVIKSKEDVTDEKETNYEEASILDDDRETCVNDIINVKKEENTKTKAANLSTKKTSNIPCISISTKGEEIERTRCKKVDGNVWRIAFDFNSLPSQRIQLENKEVNKSIVDTRQYVKETVEEVVKKEMFLKANVNMSTKSGKVESKLNRKSERKRDNKRLTQPDKTESKKNTYKERCIQIHREAETKSNQEENARGTIGKQTENINIKRKEGIKGNQKDESSKQKANVKHITKPRSSSSASKLSKKDTFSKAITKIPIKSKETRSLAKSPKCSEDYSCRTETFKTGRISTEAKTLTAEVKTLTACSFIVADIRKDQSSAKSLPHQIVETLKTTLEGVNEKNNANFSTSTSETPYDSTTTSTTETPTRKITPEDEQLPVCANVDKVHIVANIHTSHLTKCTLSPGSEILRSCSSFDNITSQSISEEISSEIFQTGAALKDYNSDQESDSLQSAEEQCNNVSKPANEGEEGIDWDLYSEDVFDNSAFESRRTHCKFGKSYTVRESSAYEDTYNSFVIEKEIKKLRRRLHKKKEDLTSEQQEKREKKILQRLKKIVKSNSSSSIKKREVLKSGGRIVVEVLQNKISYGKPTTTSNTSSKETSSEFHENASSQYEHDFSSHTDESCVPFQKSSRVVKEERKKKRTEQKILQKKKRERESLVRISDEELIEIIDYESMEPKMKLAKVSSDEISEKKHDKASDMGTEGFFVDVKKIRKRERKHIESNESPDGEQFGLCGRKGKQPKAESSRKGTDSRRKRVSSPRIEIDNKEKARQVEIRKRLKELEQNEQSSIRRAIPDLAERRKKLLDDRRHAEERGKRKESELSEERRKGRKKSEDYDKKKPTVSVQKTSQNKGKVGTSSKVRSRTKPSEHHFVVNYVTPNPRIHSNERKSLCPVGAKTDVVPSVNTSNFMKMVANPNCTDISTSFDDLDLDKVEVYCGGKSCFETIQEHLSECESVHSAHSAHSYQMAAQGAGPGPSGPKLKPEKSDSREIGEILKLFGKVLKIMSRNKV